MTKELPEWATLRDDGDVEVETALQALVVLDYIDESEDEGRNIIVTDPIQARYLAMCMSGFGYR